VKLLLDANVLLRWADSRAPEHTECAEAVAAFAGRSNVVYVCAQVMIESYVAATRPVEVNGLGFTTAEGRRFLGDIEDSFPCLPELPNMGKLWAALVTRHSVIGKPAHDARIVALMLAHNVTHLLTLNPGDFARYTEITTVTPAEWLNL
jgi:predicted nucleic acid-binding protein